MKTIGIIGAMEEEIRLLKHQMTQQETHRVIGRDFYRGRLAGQDVLLARCGVGKVSAALCVQVLALRFGVERVINTGCAGGLCPDLDMGDVVISSALVQHDVDVSPAGSYVPGQVPGFKSPFIPADPHLMALAQAACEAALTAKVAVGPIATGDRFVADAALKHSIREAFGALCVEMEGGAIAQACALNQLPFVVIRAVSDKADKQMTVSFDEFVHLASENSCKVVLEMLGRMER
jgi:adenosylhomocysteine nucleosidase